MARFAQAKISQQTQTTHLALEAARPDRVAGQ